MPHNIQWWPVIASPVLYPDLASWYRMFCRFTFSVGFSGPTDKPASSTQSVYFMSAGTLYQVYCVLADAYHSNDHISPSPPLIYSNRFTLLSVSYWNATVYVQWPACYMWRVAAWWNNLCFISNNLIWMQYSNISGVGTKDRTIYANLKCMWITHERF